MTIEKKSKKFRAILDTWKCNLGIVTATDQIAWLLNLRGADSPFCPLFQAFLVIFCGKQAKFHLYSDPEKFKDPAVQEYLSKYHIVLKPYEQFIPDLKLMEGMRIGVKMKSINSGILRAINNKSTTVDIKNSFAYTKVLGCHSYN